jgi:hypothetical protein
MADVFYEDRLPGGTHWSMELRRGTQMRLIDDQGGANVGMLFYNPRNLLERYNAPDTLKCQHTFKLTRGHCLYSDMGRIFCSIIEDTVGWHDTIGGNLNNAQLERKWGVRTYQQAFNDWTLSGYNSFLIELAKYGLTKRDLAANLNIFSKVTADDNGDLRYIENNSSPGDEIVLRFEMDTLVLLHTCPHPLNPAGEYPRKSVIYRLSEAEPATPDDFCMNSRPENQRGFKNNALYHLGGKQCC